MSKYTFFWLAIYNNYPYLAVTSIYRTLGPVDLSYVAEIFLKMYLIKVKPVKFGHPNKQVLTKSECVLRKTLRAEPFIRLPLLFIFRLE